MRRTRRSNVTRWLMRFGAPLAAAWLVAACGQDPLPAQGEEVLALDLQSGERRRFKSPEEVPPGWGVCADDACTIPPSIPCESLGLRLCVDQPNCRARLVCELDFGDGPVAVPEPFALNDGDAPLSRYGSTEESVDCKMTCATRAPSSCEAAADEKTCLGMSSTRCEWVPVGPCISPALRCGGGTRCLPPMPPPECPMACRAAAPLPPPPPPVDPCQKVTDQRRCVADPACEWFSGPAICPACLGPGCDCRPPAPGSGECRRNSGPKSCFDLDAKTCQSKRECVWAPGICRLCAMDGLPGCGTCSPSRCMPREVDPPPPPPAACAKVLSRAACEARSECLWAISPLTGWVCDCPKGARDCRCNQPPLPPGKCVDRPPSPPPAPKCFVGGCSGEICSDKPDQVSICIFPPPGGMPSRGAVCDRQTDGTCGWSIPAVY